MLFNNERIVVDTSWSIASGTTELGREPNGAQHIALLGDPHLSRQHAILERRGQTLHIRDADSRNGTFVNGHQVTASPLVDGDIIRLSDTVLMIRFQPDDSMDADVPELIGDSPAIGQLRHFVGLTGPTEATAVLIGETGTGKGVMARAIHRASPRSDGPFVAINCAAIPEALAESALFGHRAGAFTGAARDTKGYFRAADGGTLFMDEIGELPETVQPKLLHAIEERAVVPVGSTAPVECDIRIVAATTVDLTAAVQAGTFRPDLYARIADMVISLPPLRSRTEDVLPLLGLFLGDGSPPLHPNLAEALVLYHWPFNVRELKAVATELGVRGQGHDRLELKLIQHRMVDLSLSEGVEEQPRPEPRAPSVRRTSPPSREEVIALLKEHNGVVSELARSAGRSRKQIYRWLTQYELDPKDYRSD
jgi:DNA-binding NtrC family response regulator